MTLNALRLQHHLGFPQTESTFCCCLLHQETPGAWFISSHSLSVEGTATQNRSQSRACGDRLRRLAGRCACPRNFPNCGTEENPPSLFSCLYFKRREGSSSSKVTWETGVDAPFNCPRQGCFLRIGAADLPPPPLFRPRLVGGRSVQSWLFLAFEARLIQHPPPPRPSFSFLSLALEFP